MGEDDMEAVLFKAATEGVFVAHYEGGKLIAYVKERSAFAAEALLKRRQKTTQNAANEALQKPAPTPTEPQVHPTKVELVPSHEVPAKVVKVMRSLGYLPPAA